LAHTIIGVVVITALCVGAFATQYTGQETVNKAYDLNLPVKELFLEWASDFASVVMTNKTTDIELQIMYLNFQQNLERMKVHNRNYPSAHFNLNAFSGLNEIEFGVHRLNPIRASIQLHARNRSEAASQKRVLSDLSDLHASLPSSFDWRRYHRKVVGPVYDQGACGSCWAHAAAEVVESAWAIAKHNWVSLSRQQIVDCTTPNYGCQGGAPDLAYDVIEHHGGLHLSHDYPYHAKNGRCRKFRGGTAKVMNHVDIPAGANNMKAAIMKYGPINIGVDATHWGGYHSGVMTSLKCYHQTNHEVVIVGWGTFHNIHSWIIKNSWSEKWGMGGYILVEISDAHHICGVGGGGGAVVSPPH